VRGAVTTKSVLNRTSITHVVHRPSIIKPFNVVLDGRQRLAGLVAPKLFERLPCKTTRLCFDIDGQLPAA